MLLTELQTYSLTHLAKVPFSSTSSSDNSFSFISEKGLDILGGVSKTGLLRWLICLVLITSLVPTSADDATHLMFGDQTDGLPAAFGDFNSDELTDLFVIREDGQTLEILFGEDKEPFMKSKDCKCHFTKYIITSVVPGDFNGDALMDVLVTVMEKNSQGNGAPILNKVILLKGTEDNLICNSSVLFEMKGQPLAIDYDKNMIIDLFGLDDQGERSYWLFSNNDTQPYIKIPMKKGKEGFNGEIRMPHSHAFLDFDRDQLADLYITTNENFEIWRGNEDIKGGFVPWRTVPLPAGFSKNSLNGIGQTVFLDVELKGKLNQLVPICYDSACKNNSIVVYSEHKNKWYDLSINFNEPGPSNTHWHFTLQKHTLPYTGAITLRPGDFDMDGYPDLLATLVNDKNEFKSFFLKNIPCKTTCSEFSRTFEIQWTELNPHNNNTVLGVFFDFMQDGVLDIIFVHYNQLLPKKYNVSVFKNTAIYDANFMKVMVITGLTNKDKESTVGSLRKYKKVYGTNLPGPTVFYETTTQEGDPRKAAATQIPQSAHHSLNLPYTIFGLGRTPNFIENLTVEVYGNQREWFQLIPNSQMVVIPWPIEKPASWKVQLFVTPSKLIYQSVFALLATCVVISIIIAILYWKERKEDHLERLQEAHRFHFDAM